MSAQFNGQTSGPYGNSNTGIHLELIKWRTTLTVAVLKIFPKISFTERQNERFEFITEHLKRMLHWVSILHVSQEYTMP